MEEAAVKVASLGRLEAFLIILVPIFTCIDEETVGKRTKGHVCYLGYMVIYLQKQSFSNGPLAQSVARGTNSHAVVLQPQTI